MERMYTKLTRVREETIDNRSVSVFSSKNWDQEEPENWLTIMRRYGGGRGIEMEQRQKYWGEHNYS